MPSQPETADDELPAPEPSGPFFSNCGPHDGMILRDVAQVMGVLNDQGQIVGIAWLNGSTPSRRGPAQVWRLEVRKRTLEGRWICRNRRFERLGDAAE